MTPEEGSQVPKQDKKTSELSLPDGWETRRLKTVADIYPSNIDKKSHDGEESVKLCNYTDVYYNNLITDDIEFMEATAKDSKINRFRLRKGDIIATKDSESQDEIGVTARVAQDFGDVLCGYHLFLIRPRDEEVDPEYLYWALNSRYVRSQFEVLANGVTRFGITTQNASDISVPMPPRERQGEIAAFIAHQDDRIRSGSDNYEQLIDNLHEKRNRTVYEAAIGKSHDGEFKDSEVGWIGDIPEHWDVVRTRFVARLESGHTPSKSNDEYWKDTNIPWVTTSDIKPFRNGRKIYLNQTEYQISELGLENSGARLLPKGTVFLSRTASVGFSGIMDEEMATSQDFANWVCSDEIVPEYLLYVFRSMDQEFDRLTQGSTHQTIYMPDIRSFKTPLPPIEEQREIVDHIQTETERIWELIDKVEETINLLEDKRQALITAAVTGQINVTENQSPELETTT